MLGAVRDLPTKTALELQAAFLEDAGPKLKLSVELVRGLDVTYHSDVKQAVTADVLVLDFVLSKYNSSYRYVVAETAVSTSVGARTHYVIGELVHGSVFVKATVPEPVGYFYWMLATNSSQGVMP